MTETICRLTSETVQGTTLALQSVDDIHSGDGLALGVLRVGDGIADDVLKEHLQNTTGLLVDETRDALHTTSTCKTTDGRLRDALDVITKNLAMTLGATLAETFTALSSS
jgi:hypothetical protein